MLSYKLLEIVSEKGISLDGKPLVNEQGILRYNAIDWDKTNPIIKEEILNNLCEIPEGFLKSIDKQTIKAK